MTTIQAIYENGVFRPLGPVDLPEGSAVQVVVEPAASEENGAHLDRVYGLLSRRFKSGRNDLAEPHDEHQPQLDN